MEKTVTKRAGTRDFNPGTSAATEIPAEGANRLYVERRLLPSAVVDRPRVTVNLAESPLGWLARRGLVSSRQFDAGERLRGDFTRAQMAPRTTMSWDSASSGRTARGAPDAVDPSTAQLSAKRRFEAAILGVGPGLSDILWRVACNGEGMETAERALGWPARAGKGCAAGGGTLSTWPSRGTRT